MIRTIRQSAGKSKMQFGQRVRAIRKSKDLTQRQLAHRLGVSFSHISKVENERLQFGDYPSEKFIHKLAAELDADEDELLLLADKVPAGIRKRIREKPEAFRAIASLDDSSLDKLVERIGARPRKRKTR
jgi:transcriptional regulator with XRE-family HTH domain